MPTKIVIGALNFVIKNVNRVYILCFTPQTAHDKNNIDCRHFRIIVALLRGGKTNRNIQTLICCSTATILIYCHSCILSKRIPKKIKKPNIPITSVISKRMAADDPHTPRTLLFLLHISKTCTYNYLQKKHKTIIFP